MRPCRYILGREGAETFFGSADLHQFFGNRDPMTLDWVSGRVGVFAPDDLPDEPRHERIISNDMPRDPDDPWHPLMGEMDAMARQYDRDVYMDKLSRFNTEASRVLGRPRLPPDRVGQLVRKEGEGVARGAISFVFGGKPIFAHLLPFFDMDKVQWGLLPSVPAPTALPISTPVPVKTAADIAREKSSEHTHDFLRQLKYDRITGNVLTWLFWPCIIGFWWWLLS